MKTGVLEKGKQINAARAREVYNLVTNKPAAGAALEQLHMKCRSILHVKVERVKKHMRRKESLFSSEKEIQHSI